MNIAINLLPFREKIAGAGRYARHLVAGLQELDKDNRYFLFLTPQSTCHFKVTSENFSQVICNFNSEKFFSRIFWEQFIFPFQLRKIKIDLLLTPSVAIPIFYRGKKFTTIHDVAYKRITKKYPLLRKWYLAFMTRIAAKKSDIIFTVSEFSRKEISNTFSLEKEKIIVSYNGVDKVFCELPSNKKISEIKSKYNLPNDYIIYLGAIEPSKNILTLLGVFKNLTEKDKQFEKLGLIFTGGVNWNTKNFNSKIDELRLRNKIQILPYLNDEDLNVVLRCSKLLVYISLYEGFGLPVLEAMAAGVPVIASNVPSILEFANNCALLVNPYDITIMINNITKILLDDNFRGLLIKKGLERASDFDWKNSSWVIYTEILKVM